MRFLKYFLIIVVVLAGLGYGVYHFGTKYASEKLVDVVSSELVESGEIEEVKQAIENDPKLKSLVEDVQSVDESTLPFTTKEEATKEIVKKIGVSGIQEIQSKVQQGEMTQEELIREAQKHFTEEEIEALKVIAYKELYGK